MRIVGNVSDKISKKSEWKLGLPAKVAAAKAAAAAAAAEAAAAEAEAVPVPAPVPAPAPVPGLTVPPAMLA